MPPPATQPRHEPPDGARVPTTLGEHFLRQLPRFAVGTALLGAYQYSQYWFDTRLKVAVDGAFGGRLDVAVDIGRLLVAVAAAAFVIRVLSRMAIFNGGRIVEYELRLALLHHLQRLGPSFYRRMSTGEIMSRATNDLAQIRLLLGFGVLNGVNTAFALVSALAVMLGLSWRLTLASLATLPILLLVSRAFGRLMYTFTRENQDAIGRVSERVQSSIAGVRVVRAFGLERSEARAFAESNEVYLDASLRLARLRGSFGPIIVAVTALGVVIVVWYGGHLVLGGALTPGDFLSFYRALVRLTWPLVSLGLLVAIVQRGRASFSRLEEIFHARPDIVDGEVLATERTGRLTVRGLSFGYGDAQVLHDVSFSLERGESLAIVGRTGSGKSTLAVLLARLQPTPRGAISLDGHDICDLPLAELRARIGFAQQTPFLFSTTVGRNIGYVLEDPDSEASAARVRAAAREAQIHDEIRGLPDGFDTVVGERGVQLSGGQKQRVALARALLSEPEILVLDDPLSAVDARTENAILDAIDRQRAVRGVILITHRVAAAARCDRVIVLDAGRVVDEGTHEELIRRGGLYATFADEQRIERELAALGGPDPWSPAVASP